MDKLPTIEEMLERQGRFWEIRRRVAQEVNEDAAHRMLHLLEGPWITLSRQLGSGGIELGRRLAHDLGWQLFDREILGIIAEHTHTREAVLSRLDEAAIGPIEDYIRGLLERAHPGRTPFLNEMVRVIWGLAKQGQAVIVGRGANWFLDPRFGLRLRVVAPLEQRVARISRDEGLNLADARRRVEKHDADQESFIRQVYRRSIDDLQGYDLVLNLGGLEIDVAVGLVRAALERKLGLAA
jgi:cytidylate kinase